MVTSTFDLFRIGIGPSSSHTMGPVVAGADFAMRVVAAAARIEVDMNERYKETSLGGIAVNVVEC